MTIFLPLESVVPFRCFLEILHTYISFDEDSTYYNCSWKLSILHSVWARNTFSSTCKRDCRSPVHFLTSTIFILEGRVIDQCLTYHGILFRTPNPSTFNACFSLTSNSRANVSSIEESMLHLILHLHIREITRKTFLFLVFENLAILDKVRAI